MVNYEKFEGSSSARWFRESWRLAESARNSVWFNARQTEDIGSSHGVNPGARIENPIDNYSKCENSAGLAPTRRRPRQSPCMALLLQASRHEHVEIAAGHGDPCGGCRGGQAENCRAQPPHAGPNETGAVSRIHAIETGDLRGFAGSLPLVSRKMGNTAIAGGGSVQQSWSCAA